MTEDKFISEENPFYTPICNNCKNYIKDLQCEAFGRIPQEILTGKNNHSKPLSNQDNDIVYEPKK